MPCHPCKRYLPVCGSTARRCWASTAEPAAELLALIWGPRFDREHAQQLVRSAAYSPASLLPALALAADTFDRLPAPRQQRLRQALYYHAAGTTIGA